MPLALVCFAALASQAGEIDLSTDARLQGNVSARLKIAALPDALRTIEAATKVPLRAAPGISDLKCVMLVQDRPAAAILSHLADTFRCEWTRQGEGYVLSMSAKGANKEKEYLDLSDRLKLARAQRQSQAYAWAGGVASKDRELTIKELDRQIGEAYKDKDVAKRTPIVEQLQERRLALSQTQMVDHYVLASMMRGMDNAAWVRFWGGEFLIGSPEAVPGALDLIRANRFPPSDDPDKRVVLARFRPSTSMIMLSELTFNSETGSAAGASKTNLSFYTFGSEINLLNSLPLGKDCLAWKSLPAEAPELNQIIDGDAPEKPSPYVSGYYSDAEHLEWLFDNTKIPIIGTAFRVPNRWSSLQHPGPMRAYLKTFAESSSSYFRFSDGFLCYRRGNFPGLRRLEISESILKPLEQKKSLTADDYASLVQKLTPFQADSITWDANYLTEFSLRPLSDCLPALRFYATLPVGDRARALAGRPVEVRSLPAASQRAFLEVLQEGIFTWSNMKLPMLNAILQGDPKPFADFTFVIATKDVRAGRNHKPMPLDWFDTHDSYSDNGSSESLPGIAFKFNAPDGSTGMQFTTTLMR